VVQSLDDDFGEEDQSRKQKGPFLSIGQRGMSLIGVLAAVAILGVLIAGTTTYMNQALSSQAYVKMQSEILVFHEEVRSLFGIRQACTQTFQGLDLTAPRTVTQLKDDSGANKYLTGEVYGDRSFRLATVTLMDYSPTPSPGQATVSISYAPINQILGPIPKPRTILLQVTSDGSPGNLTSCVAFAKASADSFWKQSSSQPSDIYYSIGNVGIGTAAPNGPLDVRGGTGNTHIRLADTNTSAATNLWSHIDLIAKNGAIQNSIWAAADSADSYAGRGQIGTTTDHPFWLVTNSAPRIVVSNAGNVGVGTTAPAEKLVVVGNILASNHFIDYTYAPQSSSPLCRNDTTGVHSNCTSDGRLKSNVAEIPASALSKVLQLRPVEFNWITQGGKRDAGFIAQEVKHLFPLTVGGDESQTYLSFSPGSLMPYAVKAIQELESENSRLRAQLQEIRKYLCEKDSRAPACSEL
jgi:hypothetical protein